MSYSYFCAQLSPSRVRTGQAFPIRAFRTPGVGNTDRCIRNNHIFAWLPGLPEDTRTTSGYPWCACHRVSLKGRGAGVCVPFCALPPLTILTRAPYIYMYTCVCMGHGVYIHLLMYARYTCTPLVRNITRVQHACPGDGCAGIDYFGSCRICDPNTERLMPLWWAQAQV
jgi:hypothetical protein